MKTSRFAALTLSIILIISLFYTVPAQQTQPVASSVEDALWIATIGNLVKLDPGDGSTKLEPPDTANLLRFAVDEADGTLWAYSQGTLSAFDSFGNLLLTSAVPPPASSTKNLALAVNSNDGSVWLALQKNLHHFDDQGELLETITLSAQAVDLSFDPTTNHLWAATQSTVQAFDEGGAVDVTLSLPRKAKVVSIAVDKANGNLWVALSTGLQLYDSNGALLGQTTLKNLDKLADDSNHGIWAVSGSSLLRISASLQRLLSITPLPKKAKVNALIGDPTDQSVWVGGSKSLVHLNSNGTNLLSISLRSNLNDLALQRSDVSENRQPVANNDSALTAQNNPITITVLGNDSDPDGDSLTIQSITQGSNGKVKNNSTTVTYTPSNNFHGTDSFTYTISDGKGHNATATVNVTVDQAPQVNAGQDQTITLPANASLSGTVTDDGLPTPVNLTQSWSKVSGPGTVNFANANATSTTASFSQAGTYVLKLTANDGFLQNSDNVQITVNSAGGGGGGVPPDPSTVAPPNDPSTTTTIAASTQFLYTGTNPIQTGVVNGTIDPVRAAVLRGKILDRNNAPISGVTVKILDRPEFGQTLSRADGMFDLAVNGGSSLTIDFQKTGLLPAQRQVNVPWQDFVVLPDIVLIGLDTQVTPIALNSANTQVARGSISSDVDGNRRATLVFKPGTTANMILPNGSSQPLANMQVRATEYTIGENGPKSMPAPLPPTSGYTYAVELSADEAIAAGAKKVVFNQPVIKYLENFLNFPVGTIVPVGSYDRDLGAWLPEDNGKVIKIISISSGFANLDTDEDGIVDNGTSLGVTDTERAQLATLYSAGQTLWRVPIAHFSPFDCNFPYGPPPDYTNPNQPEPPRSTPEKDPCEKNGSIVECQNQILGETIRVAGTPYRLNYRSDRVPGRKANYTLSVQLSGANVPSSLKRIDLEIAVAGKTFNQSFNPAPNQSFTFTWDGVDAYGRLVQGAQVASVQVSYVYGLLYMEPAQLVQSWAQISPTNVALASRPSKEILSVQKFVRAIGGSWDARGVGLGAWMLNVHHAYDPGAQVLHRGDGRRVTAQDSRTVINTIAGSGSRCFDPTGPCGDGGPATLADMDFPGGIAVAPNGDIYVSTSADKKVRKILPDGIIATVAGTGEQCFPSTDSCGDGGPATQATFGVLVGVAFGPDGSLFVADFSGNRVRRVAPNGIVTTIAGTGQECALPTDPCGDGGPATQAQLLGPWGLAIAPDGTVYISDRGTRRIRRVSPNGTISTVVGTGQLCAGACGDGGPATQASQNEITGIALASDGTLYVVDIALNRVRRVTVDGLISTVAGGGFPKIGNGDGGPATQAILGLPTDVRVAQDGSLYIADQFQGFNTLDFRFNRIRRVGTNGVISTVAGTGELCFPFTPACGDGGPATNAKLMNSISLAIAPDGSLYIGDGGNGRVRKVGTALPKFSSNDIAVVSEDGIELYQFSSTGRHIKTLNTLTSATRHSFSYDSAGRLISITDGDGNITIVERNANGNPTGILSPFGQQTLLTLDSNGYLASVANPAKQITSMVYTPDGLLTTFTTPRGFSSHMTYDSLGRLTRDEDAAGGFWAIARAQGNASFSTTLSSALGRATTYSVQNQSTGSQVRVNTFPDGAQSQVTFETTGKTNVTTADGTLSSVTETPDPRWGMQAPLIGSAKTTTPSTLTLQQSESSTVTLSDPANLLSLQTLTKTFVINARTYSSSYNGASRSTTFTTPAGRVATEVIDLQGRPISFTQSGVHPIQATYDNRGRLSVVAQGNGPELRTTNFTYNAQGLVETITDNLGRTSSYTYNAAGRLIQEELPGNRIIQYTYDANGNLTSITPPGRPAHEFLYTQIDQTSAYRPPNIGTGTDANYSYDLDKAVSTVVHSDGRQLEYGYNSAGKLITLVSQPGNNTLLTYSYNATTGNISTLVSADAISLTYVYNGSLLTGATWSGSVSGSVGISYDTDFRVNSLTVNGINPINFSYDPDSFLTQAGTLSLSRNSQNGFLAGTTLGNVVDSYSYNGFGEASNYSANFSATPIFSQQLMRDQLGRVTNRTENINGVAAIYDYAYDLAGRLVQVKKNGIVTATYTYDANNNRLSGPGGASTYDNQDRLLSYGATTHTYNATGELASKTAGTAVTTYHYDLLGNLKSVSLPGGHVIEYLVDGRNRRVGKKLNNVKVQGFLYEDQLRPIAELDGSNNVINRFIYATNLNVPDYMIKSGVTYRLLTDHLGSPRIVINTITGTIAQQIEYDEFGNVIDDTSPGFQPFGFAGGLYDPQTKLVRFGPRDYDASVGRWTAKDPLLFSGDDTNLYAYVSNDPINFNDYDGEKKKQPGKNKNTPKKDQAQKKKEEARKKKEEAEKKKKEEEAQKEEPAQCLQPLMESMTKGFPANPNPLWENEFRPKDWYHTPTGSAAYENFGGINNGRFTR